MQQQALQYSARLSTVLQHRFALLDGVDSYIQTELLNTHDRIKTPLAPQQLEKLQRFTDQTRLTSNDIEALAITLNGTVQYRSQSDKKRFQLQQSSVAPATAQSEFEISNNLILLSPLTLDDNSIAIAGCKTIIKNHRLVGNAEITVNLNKILADTGLVNFSRSLTIEIRNAQGHTIYANSNKKLDENNAGKAELLNGGLRILASTRITTNNVDQQFIIFHLFFTVLLFLLISFALISFWQRPVVVTTLKQVKPKAATHSKQTLKNRLTTPSMFIPMIISIAIIAAVTTFYLLFNNNNTSSGNLHQSLMRINDQIDLKLNANQDYLKLIANEIASGQIQQGQLQARTQEYLSQHPSLTRIQWIDNQLVVTDNASLMPPMDDIGLPLYLPQPKEAAFSAIQNRRIVFSAPFSELQNQPTFQLYIPIFQQRILVGILSASYSINSLLEAATPKDYLSQFQIQFTDKSGKVLSTINQENNDLGSSQSNAVKLLNKSLWLKLSAYQQTNNQNILLLLLLTVFSFGISLCFWWQYRESCRYWSNSETLLQDFQHFETIAQASPMAILITKPDTGRITFANAQAGRILNCDVEQLIGSNGIDYYARPEEQLRFFAAIKKHAQIDDFELLLNRKDGGQFWASVSSKMLNHQQDQSIISSVIDLSERKSHEQKLFKQANYDSLTMLPNRSMAFERLNQAIRKAKRHQQQVVLMMLDLDNFKTINDSLGHSFGDRLLQKIAEKLLTCVDSSDTVARLGGDEFTIVLPSITHIENAEAVAKNVLKTCEQPIYIEGHELRVSASIGISVFPDDGKNQQILFKNADMAMYQCKAEGRNYYRFYTEEMNRETQTSIQMEYELRRALARNEFYLQYQPLVKTSNRSINGVEALLRWNNPQLGQVPPDVFIPIAESIGLINDIGHWVLQTACAQIKQWRDIPLSAYSPQYVAVNISGNQLRQNDFIDVIRDTLATYHLPTQALELEITEGILLENTDRTCDMLSTIRKMGVRLSIDDFGTGYSSLSYLRRFPFDTLKIDRSFIKDIPQISEASQIVSAIISMATILGLEVVAEGVETEEQLTFLSNFNCNTVQGYYTGRPSSPEALDQLFQSQPDSLTAFASSENTKKPFSIPCG